MTNEFDEFNPHTYRTPEDVLAAYNKFRQREHGLPPVGLGKAEKEPKILRNFSLTVRAYTGLQEKARALGYQTKASARPNVSAMLEALGLGLIDLFTDLDLDAIRAEPHD